MFLDSLGELVDLRLVDQFHDFRVRQQKLTIGVGFTRLSLRD
mgnify:CR=1 FL=1